MAVRRVLVAAAAASVAAVALIAGVAEAAGDRDRPATGDASKPHTSDFGTPVGDNVNTLSVGPRGPQLVQDTRAFEKLARFNRAFWVWRVRSVVCLCGCVRGEYVRAHPWNVANKTRH